MRIELLELFSRCHVQGVGDSSCLSRPDTFEDPKANSAMFLDARVCISQSFADKPIDDVEIPGRFDGMLAPHPMKLQECLHVPNEVLPRGWRLICH